jgi:hypothetical protein
MHPYDTHLALTLVRLHQDEIRSGVSRTRRARSRGRTP